MVLVSLLLILLSGIPVILWSGTVSTAAGILVALSIVGIVVFYLDAGFYTAYILEADHLLIVSHFRKVRIAYRDIRSLRPGGFWGLVSFGAFKRFALSRKNVIIHSAYGRWERVSLSPAQQDHFTSELLERISHATHHSANQ